MKKILFTLLTLSILMTGCYKYKYTKAPYPTKFPSKEQKQLQSLAHWQIVARDFAKDIRKQLEMNGSNLCYLKPSSQKSIFSKNFYTFLKSELARTGNLSIKETDKCIITIDINIVKFSSDRKLPKYPFKLTSLAAGLWVATALKGISPYGAAAIGTGAIAAHEISDYQYLSKYHPDIPKFEISITSFVVKSNRYVDSMSKVYYIADKDSYLYFPDESTTFSIENLK